MSQVSLHVHPLEWWLYHSCEGWTEDSTETFAELCRGISHICRMGWEEPDRLGGWQDVIWFHLASSLLKPKIRDGCEQWWLFIWSFLPRTANIICIYKKKIYIRYINTYVYIYMYTVYVDILGGVPCFQIKSLVTRPFSVELHLPEALRPSRVKHLALVAASTKPWVSLTMECPPWNLWNQKGWNIPKSMV